MKLHLIKFIVFYLYCAGSVCFSQNNLAIIDSLIIEIVNESTKELIEQKEKNNLILDINNSDNEIAGYLRLTLGNFYSQNHKNIFRNFPVDSSFEGKVLDVRDFQIRIQYSEPYEENFLGKTFVKRHVSVVLKAQIYNFADKKVIYPMDNEAHFKDEIEFNEIENIENSPYKFTRGELADITLWQRILEPALVVSSVIVVLLLLFTQRS